MNRIDLQLGNYRLLSQIGSGGFAEVYLGEHIYLKTRAAIKMLHTHLAQEEHERFFSEAQTIAHLQHNHIVRVLEFGVEDNTPHLVMEYAPNGTLRQRYPKGTSVALKTIVPVVKQIAAALQCAHDQNLIHRDVKPENMLVGANNEVLLSDFGIALIVQGVRSQDHQEVVGTVAYMAPEQLLGKPQLASDQYALGIIVYEWLAGERPFQGSFTEVASQHIFIPPPSLREKAPSIPSAVEAAVMKALSKDPEQRFASVQEFANALEAAASASVTQPAAHIPSPQPSAVSARLQVLLVTLALLILGGGSLAYYLLALRPGTGPAALSREQLLYLQATSGTPAIDDPLRINDSLTWTSPQHECTFTGGALHVRNNSAGGGCEPILVAVSDFAYQVQATIIKGNVAGLYFRYFINLPNRPAYYFYITSDGSYSFFLGNSTTLSNIALVNYRRSPAIKTGPNQPNLLTVIASGSNIYLYINKQYVTHVVNSTTKSGSIGVLGSTTSVSKQEPVDVAFRDLQIWYL